jgi:CubicO group peptidase (beta-lactamase class C family)
VNRACALAVLAACRAGATHSPEPDRDFDVAALMAAHGIPGMSVAVIDHYEIVWAKGYGVTAKGGAVPITPKTLFLAGSISKPVTAVGALALVEHGTLALDAPIAPWHVTLAQLLDHTSGIHGGDFFPGYARGAPVPALSEILADVHVTAPPGTRWEYSGTGYLVVQQTMMSATGRPFAALMNDLVLAPLAMADSTFEQPLPETRAPAAAAGTLMNGQPVEGGWRTQPEQAAGGLWTTPSDLARFAIEIARASRGRSHRVLSQQMALAMITPHWSDGVINILGTARSPDRMGYGFFVGDRHRFGHVGGNAGYQATLVMFADTGQGAVVMTSSDIGLTAGNALLNRIAEVYGWGYVAPPPP